MGAKSSLKRLAAMLGVRWMVSHGQRDEELTFFTNKADFECPCAVNSLILLSVFLAEDIELNVGKANSGFADSLDPFRRSRLMCDCNTG